MQVESSRVHRIQHDTYDDDDDDDADTAIDTNRALPILDHGRQFLAYSYSNIVRRLRLW